MTRHAKTYCCAGGYPDEEARFIGTPDQVERFISEVERWTVILKKPISAPRMLDAGERKALERIRSHLAEAEKELEHLPDAALQVLNSEIFDFQCLEERARWDDGPPFEPDYEDIEEPQPDRHKNDTR